MDNVVAWLLDCLNEGPLQKEGQFVGGHHIDR
ncbi:Protein of unknown function [Propionibacterium freudenreichii subsp. freudenreichii]|uniref:Uncharacterized protein n=1 Tax=Propionibacterium freudenreichii subsp. freudenreichii TaxID=66712 RepID=A0A0B7NV94_PROFF|nr:Protein of unknown function [Propionibacterium freudenreichii subsp. freudenreichii]